MLKNISKLTHIHNQPINKISLLVIIIIDVFVLFNVFRGLADIAEWPLSPSESYPCYAEWHGYLNDKNNNDLDKDYNILSGLVENSYYYNYYYHYEVSGIRLGEVSSLCLAYKTLRDNINTEANQILIEKINSFETEIRTLKRENSQIHDEYDSALLEKIAGQPTEHSINPVKAEEAKARLDKNKLAIKQLEEKITALKQELANKPDSSAFLDMLNNTNDFEIIAEGYDKSDFWYDSIQIGLQVGFLAPLILIVLFLHIFAQKKGYGLLALLSWHLLIIFLIPLVIKIFVFLHLGVLFTAIYNFIRDLFGGLLFLISYLYILFVPLGGYLIILFFQKIVFNKQSQIIGRIQKSRCIHCARKIRHNDHYCPYCGTEQYHECENCHEFTYNGLPFCQSCGYPQNYEN